MSLRLIKSGRYYQAAGDIHQTRDFGFFIMYAQNLVSSHADIFTYAAVVSDHSQVSFLYLR